MTRALRPTQDGEMYKGEVAEIDTEDGSNKLLYKIKCVHTKGQG